MSEVFDHVLEDKDNAEIDTTIVLSNTDTRYLYNISDEDKGDNEEKNEIPLLEKPDDNLMSNEIFSFVTGDRLRRTKENAGWRGRKVVIVQLILLS